MRLWNELLHLNVLHRCKQPRLAVRLMGQVFVKNSRCDHVELAWSQIRLHALYPTKNALKGWYGEYENRRNLPAGYVSSKPMYSQMQQLCLVVAHAASRRSLITGLATGSSGISFKLLRRNVIRKKVMVSVSPPLQK